MTSVQFATIAQSIADIDLMSRGIHSKSADNIPSNGLTECPYFAPRPRGFITDVQFSRAAFGSGGTEPMDLVYTMHWQYFHAPIGQVLTFSSYAALLENLAYIVEQIANNDAPEGSIDVQLLTIEDIAGIQDPAGNNFHGVEIAIQIKEFIK